MKNLENNFLKTTLDKAEFKDGAFALSTRAKNDPELVANATLGCLTNEDNVIVALNSVYDHFDKVTNQQKASYASVISGNPDFNESLFNWLNKDNTINLHHQVVAAPGGTGALTLAFQNMLDAGATILLPEIAWGSYKLMARQCNLNTAFYNFVDENNNICLDSLKQKAEEIMDKEGKLMFVINDPCQNPTGVSIKEKWVDLVEFLNKLSEKGSVIVVNDIAYIDYAYADSRKHFSYFNNLNENVVVLVEASCSKTLSAYGMRLGATVILSKNALAVDQIANSFTRTARTLWSNVNNGLMIAFNNMMKENEESFEEELAIYRNLLKERSEIFLSEADKYGIPYYPYTEGFFITLRVDDNQLLDKIHNMLLERHIYTIKFTRGIRVAICSMNKQTCQKLPQEISKVWKECLSD